ncbi:SUMF1/EgtB/PvdO family nonheme iron enzyme [bacterium]|nr:SUMF1/EgtB/PvdO family nonheme iron enzyme [bacterium]
MKRRMVSSGMILMLLAVLFVQGGIAATVEGHAYKYGAADHSGITIDLSEVQLTPTIGMTGLILLLAGFGLFIFRKKGSAIQVSMIICLLAGLSCITYAGFLATNVTNSLGEYDFMDVEPGDYTIDISVPGYYPEHISLFTVLDGTNTVLDITLYPIAGYLISIDSIVGNMRYVPNGTFTQGSPGSEACRSSSETQFIHTLTRNLAVMETEVTRQMWSDLLSSQPSLPADPTNLSYGSGMSNPVQSITWYEAVLFSNLLSIQNGYTPCYYRDSGFTDVVDATDYINDDHYCDFSVDGYRLATEGEWEYFCRAGTTGAFSCTETNYSSTTCEFPHCQSGEFSVLEQHAVYCANDPGTTVSVGSKLSNPWNLKDVHGNVWEWCWDSYGAYPVGSETDYEGAGSGPYRLLRGGSWGFYAQVCRSALRNHGLGGSDSAIGFRLVRISF